MSHAGGPGRGHRVKDTSKRPAGIWRCPYSTCSYETATNSALGSHVHRGHITVSEDNRIFREQAARMPGVVVYLACPLPACEKKFKNANGLKYHLVHAHTHEGRSGPDSTNPVDQIPMPIFITLEQTHELCDSRDGCPVCCQPFSASTSTRCSECDVVYHIWCLVEPTANCPKSPWRCDACVICDPTPLPETHHLYRQQQQVMLQQQQQQQRQLAPSQQHQHDHQQQNMLMQQQQQQNMYYQQQQQQRYLHDMQDPFGPMQVLHESPQVPALAGVVPSLSSRSSTVSLHHQHVPARAAAVKASQAIYSAAAAINPSPARATSSTGRPLGRPPGPARPKPPPTHHHHPQQTRSSSHDPSSRHHHHHHHHYRNGNDGTAIIVNYQPSTVTTELEQRLCQIMHDGLCIRCHQGVNESQLLLCDGNCGISMHTYCCAPPLTAVPSGDWLCFRCLRQARRRKGDPVCGPTEPYTIDNIWPMPFTPPWAPAEEPPRVHKKKRLESPHSPNTLALPPRSSSHHNPHPDHQQQQHHESTLAASLNAASPPDILASVFPALPRRAALAVRSYAEQHSDDDNDHDDDRDEDVGVDVTEAYTTLSSSWPIVDNVDLDAVIHHTSNSNPSDILSSAYSLPRRAAAAVTSYVEDSDDDDVAAHDPILSSVVRDVALDLTDEDYAHQLMDVERPGTRNSSRRTTHNNNHNNSTNSNINLSSSLMAAASVMQTSSFEPNTRPRPFEPRSLLATNADSTYDVWQEGAKAAVARALQYAQVEDRRTALLQSLSVADAPSRRRSTTSAVALSDWMPSWHFFAPLMETTRERVHRALNSELPVLCHANVRSGAVTRLNMLETFVCDDETELLLNVCGTVTAFEWCPSPADAAVQYFACAVDTQRNADMPSEIPAAAQSSSRRKQAQQKRRERGINRNGKRRRRNEDSNGEYEEDDGDNDEEDVAEEEGADDGDGDDDDDDDDDDDGDEDYLDAEDVAGDTTTVPNGLHASQRDKTDAHHTPNDTGGGGTSLHMIQLWNVGSLLVGGGTCIQPPEMVVGLAHEHGRCLSLSWCPVDAYSPPDEQLSLDTMSRVGVLAASFADGAVCLYAIPHPAELVEHYKTHHHVHYHHQQRQKHGQNGVPSTSTLSASDTATAASLDSSGSADDGKKKIPLEGTQLFMAQPICILCEPGAPKTTSLTWPRVTRGQPQKIVCAREDHTVLLVTIVGAGHIETTTLEHASDTASSTVAASRSITVAAANSAPIRAAVVPPVDWAKVHGALAQQQRHLQQLQQQQQQFGQGGTHRTQSAQVQQQQLMMARKQAEAQSAASSALEVAETLTTSVVDTDGAVRVHRVPSSTAARITSTHSLHQTQVGVQHRMLDTTPIGSDALLCGFERYGDKGGLYLVHVDTSKDSTGYASSGAQTRRTLPTYCIDSHSFPVLSISHSPALNAVVYGTVCGCVRCVLFNTTNNSGSGTMSPPHQQQQPQSPSLQSTSSSGLTLAPHGLARTLASTQVDTGVDDVIAASLDFTVSPQTPCVHLAELTPPRCCCRAPRAPRRFPLSAQMITKVSFNPNAGRQAWFAICGGNGIVRLMRIDSASQSSETENNQRRFLSRMYKK